MRNTYTPFFLSFLFTSIGVASAQVPAADAPSEPAASQPVDTTVSAPAASEQPVFSSQESQTAEAKEQSYVTKEEFDAKMNEYEAKLESLELSGLEGETSPSIAMPRLSGFFDTTFSKRWISEDTVASGVQANPQFLLQHFNLMLTEHMTDELMFIGEIRFTFLPNGAEPVFLDFAAPDPQRIDTTTVDTYTQETFRLGGIAIERVYLQWMPWEFLGVIAGYYLTPYGIWHLDHGSPTRLCVQHPFQVNILDPAAFRSGEIIPGRQLGVQVLGRIFPVVHLHIDYALTLSNGRGPADTVMDYDANKGLGLRLKVAYEQPDFEVALGGYGYTGRYTDKIIPPAGPVIAGLSYEIKETYREYAMALDFRIAIYGLILQGELLRGLVYFDDERPPVTIGAGYKPDYSSNAMYGLIGYRLPLDKLLGSMTLTPYYGIGREIPIDKKVMFYTAHWFGLNFMPSPWVTIKTEGSYVKTHFDFGGVEPPYVWLWNTQLAVSF